MLYGNESISHYSRSNSLLWMSMAFQAGVLNVGGFLACHRFVSHITGFASYFGIDVVQLEYEHAFGMLAVPVFFLLGSVLSGVLVDLRLKLHRKPRYFIIFGINFFLILLTYLGGIFGYFGPFGASVEQTGSYPLLILLCLVCGIQNGTVTTVSRSVVRTTHLTGITTDLGIGLVRYWNRSRLHAEMGTEGKANVMRLGIIFFFGLGSVVGGYCFNRMGYSGFLLPVLTSGSFFGAMLYFQVFRKGAF